MLLSTLRINVAVVTLLIVVSVSAGRDALRVTDDSRCVGAQPTQ
ncbi:MAG: hypothetical protein O9325_15485 [Roseomonas sp.]|jgi:hypothetical protein|nr:hypothetical protein [Roseomonas sp.]